MTTVPTAGEDSLVTALRRGDETAFAALVERHTPSMLRVAAGYVPNREDAEEVVQETWIALLKGLDGFQGRSSLRTWLFTVLVNIAKTRGVRERRETEVQVLAFTGGTVDPARFREAGQEWAGHWKEHRAPQPFPDTPEGSLLGDELIAVTRLELDKLPARQREVVTMRDVLGMESAEVSALLGVSAANQRVLLHRGRAAVRQALEDYVKESA